MNKRRLIVVVPVDGQDEFTAMMKGIPADRFDAYESITSPDDMRLVRFKLSGAGCPEVPAAMVIPSITYGEFIKRLQRLELLK